MQSNQTTMFQLGYLGLLPFLGGLVLIISDNSIFNLNGYQIFITYSAVILSFLSGILWGSAIDRFNNESSHKSLIFSNVFALMAWGALLFSQQHFLATLFLLIGFVLVWFAEKAIRKTDHETVPNGYQTMRDRLTVGVAVMHVILLFL